MATKVLEGIENCSFTNVDSERIKLTVLAFAQAAV